MVRPTWLTTIGLVPPIVATVYTASSQIRPSSGDEKTEVSIHERSFTEQENHWNLRMYNDRKMISKNCTHGENAENMLREITMRRDWAIHCMNYKSRDSKEAHIMRGFEDFSINIVLHHHILHYILNKHRIRLTITYLTYLSCHLMDFPFMTMRNLGQHR